MTDARADFEAATEAQVERAEKRLDCPAPWQDCLLHLGHDGPHIITAYGEPHPEARER